MYRFKYDQGWRRFDLSSPSRRDTNLQMCSKIEESLIEHELHFPPRLHLAKGLDRYVYCVCALCMIYFMCVLYRDDRERAKEVAKRRGLVIVDEEGEATHVLHPVGDVDSEVYCRPVFKKGEKCLVHFYRFPVSGLKSLGSFERNRR